MTISYVNGRYTPHGQASVHIEDRGFQFADSVYEVFAVQDGQLIDEDGHLHRLWRSLAELGMDAPMKQAPLKLVMRRLLKVNHIQNGGLYLQVSRGVARRDFPAPQGLKPTLVMTVWRTPVFDASQVKPAKVITTPDIRWKRCDIKTVQLLPGVMAKTEAAKHGAVEAWLVDETGHVTEGSSSNAWIVNKDGQLITRHTDNAILGGITRQAVLNLAADNGMEIIERSFSLDEALAATEAFTSSSTVMIRPVTQINDHIIGDGSVGPFCRKVIEIYTQHLKAGS